MPRGRRSGLVLCLRENALVVGAVGVLALFALAVLRAQLIGDSWLALIAGREIAQNGLPHHDSLFLITQGREWVDQQWLGQLGYYMLFDIGGIRLVLAANTVLVVSAGLIAFVFARRRGASPRAVLLVAPFVPLMAPWAMQVRPQTMAEVLFAATFGLLAIDRPLSRRRVAVILGLLVLWANIHGTVIIGAALAVFYGLVVVVSGPGNRRGSAVALLGLSPLCVFASPYGFDLLGYYHELLTNPSLPRFVAEWKSSTPGWLTAVFYVALLATAWLLGRYGRGTSFANTIALAVIAVSALLALRSIIWFALAAVIVITPLVDDALAGRKLLAGEVGLFVPTAVGAFVLIVAVLGFKAPEEALLRNWPSSAADRVAQIAAQDPAARVFADDAFADWLLWSKPALRGRIAYDARFELLTEHEVEVLADTGRRRERAARRFGVFVYAPSGAACPVAHCAEVFRNDDVVVALHGSRVTP